MKTAFEWDEDKNQLNVGKHGVSFEEARHAFFDADRIIARDLKHSSEMEVTEDFLPPPEELRKAETVVLSSGSEKEAQNAGAAFFGSCFRSSEQSGRQPQADGL